MLSAERHKKVLEMIMKSGSASVAELSNALSVSIVTIRRDLDRLASQGLIVRTHGGALKKDLETDNVIPEPPYSEKRRLYVAEKRRIGQRAAELVSDGEVIILDSGSTTFEMAKHLSTKHDLAVITNDLIIARTLAATDDLYVIMVGGSVRNDIFSTWGPYAERMLADLNASKLFLAADAVDVSRGILNMTPGEVPVKQLMISAAKEVILLVDHSKFEKTAVAKVCGLDRVQKVVTDTGIPDVAAKTLREMGIDLLVC